MHGDAVHDETLSSIDALFRPFTLNGLPIENRIVMAPMTRRFSPGGVPGADVATYYRRRAEGGVGLIISEGALVDHASAGDVSDVPKCYGDLPMAGWGQVVKGVHAAGSRMMVQLWHIGTTSLGKKNGVPTTLFGPSGLDNKGQRVGEPMTIAEIEAVISGYSRSACAAKLAGFDGIEIHAAHGYLIDQFLWQRTNRRLDGWGGDVAGRTRFAVEVVAACRDAVGPNFPISFRFSQWKLGAYDAKLVGTPMELEQLLKPLAHAGVDVFHCSTRRFWEPEFHESTLNLAGWAKRITGLPAITVGSVSLDYDFRDTENVAHATSIAAAVLMLERQEIDLVAVGRSLIADPNWALKIRTGAEGSVLPYSEELRNILV